MRSRPTPELGPSHQLSTIRALDYDKLGRPVHDRVTTPGSNVDGAGRRTSRTYEARGLLETLTNYDNATVESGSIVNQITYEYDGFMLLTKEWQSHTGAVTADTPKVQYGYSDGSSNHARRTSLTYPDGILLNYKYGTTGSADDVLNRVKQLKSAKGLGVSYSFLGMDRMVIAGYDCEPSVELTYVKQAGESNGDAGDQYTGLDRFGRVIDQRWRKTSSGADKERVKYGFDRAGNRQWRENTVASGGQNEVYN